MKRIVLVLLALWLCATALLPVAATEPSDPTVATVRKALADAVGTDTAGAAVVLLNGGERTMLEGVGYADIEKRIPVTADTAFELGELSGLFLLAAAHELTRKGDLDPDADIADYLPGDFMKKLALSYPVTLGDLLYGMAGFAGRTFDLRFEKDAYCFDTLEQALLSEVPRQIAEPGTFHAYSPFGLALAAYVIECVSGESYTEYLKGAILAPLGLDDTIVDPRADSDIPLAAKGHILAESGSFAPAERGGRSYGGLVPANGMISTPADLCALISYLLRSDVLDTWGTRENGVFSVGPVGLAVTERAVLLQAATLYFGGALAIDTVSDRACLVLFNTPGSTLSTLPAEAFSAAYGAYVEEAGGLPDIKEFEGVYADATGEWESLVGRLFLKDANQKAKATDDGYLSFLGMTLRQIAPGVFADVDDESGRAVIQFLRDGEGDVTAVLHANGSSYLPVPFWRRAVPSLLLLGLLVVLCAYFLLGAVFGLAGAIRARIRERYDRPWRFLFPWLGSGLFALLCLLQLFVAATLGALAVPSFYSVISVLALVAIVLAVGAYLLAFFTAFTERGRTARVVYPAMLFVAVVLLSVYWGIIRF